MKKTGIVLRVAFLGVLLCSLCLPSFVVAQKIKVLSGRSLYTIDPVSPSKVSSPVAINNIPSAQTIAGMDYRPSTGRLYALGYNPTNQTASLYILNTETGIASIVGTGNFSLPLGNSPLGFDFDPVNERIRVSGTATAQTLLLNADQGSVILPATTISYSAKDSNANKVPFIGSIAYTQSFIAAPATDLIGYDDSLNVFCKLSTDSTGNLIASVIGNTTGFIKNTNDKSSDLDIYYNPNPKKNIAYFIANPGDAENDNLFTLDLQTGKTKLIGGIGNGIPVQDIAVVLDRKNPNPSGQLIYGLSINPETHQNNLLTFYSENPSFITQFIPLEGLSGAERIVGMDFRPKDLTLFGLAMAPTSDSAYLYRVNFSTRTWERVNNNPIDLKNHGGQKDRIGFDFDPTTQLARVVSGPEINYVLNVDSAKIVARDSAWSMGSYPIPAKIYTAAHTNSYAFPTSSTTFYSIEQDYALLLRSDTPSNGRNSFSGSLTIDSGAVLMQVDMDIVYEPKAKKNLAFASVLPNKDSAYQFYSIDLENGACLKKGTIGNGIAVTDIAGELPVGIIDAIASHAAEAYSFRAYPNPVSSATTVQIFSKEEAQMDLVITDMLGRVLQKRTLATKEGLNTMEIDLSMLSPGVYQLSIGEGSKGYRTLKVLKL